MAVQFAAMSVMRMLLLGCLLAAALVSTEASEYKCEEDAGSCPEYRGIQCGGYGECICGHCACQPGFYGDSCQCSSVTCLYSNGKICGGPDRGRCECGVCECKQGFTGDACQCPLSQSTCVASNGKICNGKGQCECGKCRCERDSYYFGPTCEDCPTCPGKCQVLKACVQFMLGLGGPLNQEEYSRDCRRYNIRAVDSVTGRPRGFMCRFRTDDDCTMLFKYKFNRNNQIRVFAQRTQVCPAPGR